jgi:hypothetical protein
MKTERKLSDRLFWLPGKKHRNDNYEERMEAGH